MPPIWSHSPSSRPTSTPYPNHTQSGHLLVVTPMRYRRPPARPGWSQGVSDPAGLLDTGQVTLASAVSQPVGVLLPLVPFLTSLLSVPTWPLPGRGSLTCGLTTSETSPSFCPSLGSTLCCAPPRSRSSSSSTAQSYLMWSLSGRNRAVMCMILCSTWPEHSASQSIKRDKNYLVNVIFVDKIFSD